MCMALKDWCNKRVRQKNVKTHGFDMEIKIGDPMMFCYVSESL